MKALELADRLDAAWLHDGSGEVSDLPERAAAEIRRLDALLDAMHAINTSLIAGREQARAEVARLRSTPPEQREDLHRFVADMASECNQLRAEVERLRAPRRPLANERIGDLLMRHHGWLELARAIERADGIGAEGNAV